MTLSIGAKLGPYEIVVPLGAGGMGEVYRARDTRLDRDVAVKVMPDRVANDPLMSARFQREAKVVAALSHPNILAIYDVGQQDGVAYVVTELLEGQTLRQTMLEGSLPTRKAIEVAVAVADGLAAAHARGVVHRDLKPENIFLTSDGVVKILDFGLARMESEVQPASDAAHTPTVTLNTSPGTVLGTINYMSPEQIRAQKTDARSDVFSFGCVLYEMLTGERAFQGETSADTMTAILREPPKSVRSSRRAIGPELERVIDRCLEKKAEARFQSSQDLAFTLRSILADSGSSVPREAPKPARRRGLIVGLIAAAIVVGGFFVVRHELRQSRFEARATIGSIAVLPLENVSRDPEQEYFVDGMTEALISDLAKIGGLKVISRTSVMRYKATTKSLPEIAKELNVEAIVEGSVQRAGDRVRITAQLILAATDEHLWAESYDRDLSDVLRLQSEVARTIAQEIKVKLTPQEQTRMVAARSVDPQAYQAYLKGRFCWNKFTPDSLQKAIEYFEQAISLDPEWPLAYAGLAETYTVMPHFASMRPGEAIPKARAAAAKALELDRSLGEVHSSLAWIATTYDWDWPAAKREFEQAISFNPNHPTAHLRYGLFFQYTGRHEDAIREMTRAQELDPLAPINGTAAAEVYYLAEQFEQAEALLRKTLELSPDFAFAHNGLAKALVLQGRYSEATTEAREAVRLSNNAYRFVATLGYVCAKAGQPEEARRILDEFASRSADDYVAPTYFAIVHAGLDERERVFEWLEKAYQERDVLLPITLNEPILVPVRADPRFIDLVRRVGLPPLAPSPSATPQPPPLPRGDKGGSPSAEKHTLAVLPFVNQSGNPDDEYFSDGMTDELASALMKVPGLRVAARSSAFTFKGRNVEAREVGAKLDVATVLEGTVRRSGSKLRVTAQLVNAADGLVRWSEKYEREAKDVFAVQDDITGAIVSALQLTLGAGSIAGNKAGRTDNAEARDLYLRGRFLAFKQTEEGLRSGLDYFEQAIEKDPGYAPAYAGITFAYMWLADGFTPPREAYPKAKAAVLKALELDSTNAEAHTYLGLIRWLYDWEFESMDVEFRRALQLNPNSMEAHNFFGMNLCGMNRWDEGLAEVNRAIVLDPLSPVPSWTREYCLVIARRYDDTIAQNKKTTELDPNFFYLESLGALAYREKGMLSESVAEYQRLLRIIGDQPIYGLAITYARMGRTAEARDILKEFLELSKQKYVSPDQIALIYAALGEKDEAFAWLDRAYEARSGWMTVWLLGSPDYDPLRSDPRFDALLKRIGLSSLTPPPSKTPLPPPLSSGGRGGLPSAENIRLAVLPFANDSGDNELDYLSDGIAETLINGFSRLEGLSTVPRSTAFRHKGDKDDPVQVGRKLSATAVLTGRVLKRGDQLTIQAELTDVAQGRQLWGERYQKKFADLVEIERDIAKDITDALRLRLTGEEQKGLSRGYSQNAEAYRLYLQGRFWWSKRTKEGFDQALRLLNEAVQIDPNFALAYSGIADTYSLLPLYGLLKPRDARTNARAAAEKALRLDDALAEAHSSMGMVYFYLDWDFVAADKEFARAQELNPRYATTYQWSGLCMGVRGQFAEAKARLRRALELDPLMPILTHNLAWVHMWEHDWDGARTIAKSGLEFAPEFPWLNQSVGLSLLALGKPDEAIPLLRRSVDLAASASFANSYLAYGLGLSGRKAECQAIIDEWLEFNKWHYVPPTDIAIMYVGLGDLDEAIKWLEKGLEERDVWMTFLSVLPFWDPLRDDPRFASLLQRVGLPDLSASSVPSNRPPNKPTP